MRSTSDIQYERLSFQGLSHVFDPTINPTSYGGDQWYGKKDSHDIRYTAHALLI